MKKKKDNCRFSRVLTAALCALLGAGLLVISMKQGVGVGGDATIYMNSARNLLVGKGIGLITAAGDFRLIPYFPPFYPLILSVFGYFGIDLSQAAYFLNLAFLGLLVFCISLRTQKVTGSLYSGLLIGLLLAGSPILLPAYSWAMSEPPSILLGFGALLLLGAAFSSGSSMAFWGSAVLAGLSFLTRYASAAFIAAAVCWVFFFFPFKDFANRFCKTFFYGVLSLLPMGVWLLYDYRMTGTVASRSLLEGKTAELRAALIEKVKQVFSVWLLPESMSHLLPAGLLTVLSLVIILLPFALAVSACVRLKWFPKHRNSREQTASCGLTLGLSVFCLAYEAVIAYVSLNTYPPITINSRMLLPFYIAECWLGVLLLHDWIDRADSRFIGALLSVGLLGFALLGCVRALRIARQNAIDGLGYNAVNWKNSDTIAFIREKLPEDAAIVTNEETALLYLLDRRSYPVHEVYVNQPDEVYYAYESETASEGDAGRELFRRGEAYLVLFDTFEDQLRDIYGEDTQLRMDALLRGLHLVDDNDDGMIFTLN